MSCSEGTQLVVEDSLPPVGAPVARFSAKRAYAQTFSAMVAIRCAGAVSGVLAARLLGPTGRGELAVIVFLPMLLAPIGELELHRSVAFETSQPGELPGKLIATSFWLAVLLGSIQAMVLASVLPLFLPPDKLNLLHASRWFMLYLPAAYVAATLMGSDQGRGRFGRFSFLMALPGALYTVAILTAWGSGRSSPSFFAFGLLISTLLTAAVRLCIDGQANPFGRPDLSLARRLLARGLSFYLPAIAGFVLSRTDMFILVRLAPTEAVGLYAVAQAIALGQIGAVNPFIQVGFSAVAGEAEPRRALQTLARHFRVAQLSVISVGLLAAAATPWLIRLMFGVRFCGAVATANLLIGGTALWGMSQMLEEGLRAASHPRVGVVSNLLGLGVMFGLGIPGCRRFGINGIATSLVAAQFVNFGVLVTFCVLWLKMPLGQFWAFTPGMFSELKVFVRPILHRLQIVARRGSGSS